jgi:hypothetical protein
MVARIFNLLTINKAYEIAYLYGLQNNRYIVFIDGKMYDLETLKPRRIDRLYHDLRDARKEYTYVYEIEGYEFVGV